MKLDWEFIRLKWASAGSNPKTEFFINGRFKNDLFGILLREIERCRLSIVPGVASLFWEMGRDKGMNSSSSMS
jgi:hypothetical protein